jgi:hypothetical protein
MILIIRTTPYNLLPMSMNRIGLTNMPGVQDEVPVC